MTRDDPVANIVRGWRMAARAAVAPSPHFGVVAAIWARTAHSRREIRADPNPSTHSIAFAQLPLTGEARIDDRPMFCGRAPVGACNLVQAGQSPYGVFTGPWRFLHIYLPDGLLTRLADEEGMRRPASGLEFVNPRWTLQPELWRIARDVSDELAADRPLRRLKMDSLGLSCAIALLRGHSTAHAPGRAPAHAGGLAPWQLNRVCEAMMAQIDGGVGLAELAEIAGCSATHLSRAFKQSTGLAPFHWLAERRVEKAKALLEEGVLPLADVALAVGFSAQPQFTTAFKRVTGVTPGAWRRERLS